MTLAEAQAWLRENVDHGASCPCCTQFAKVYKRKLHAAMARDLIIFQRATKEPDQYLSVPRVLGHDGGDFAKLVYWGLIEQAPGKRKDGSPRVGFWRLTDHGRAFVAGVAQVQSHARIYDGRCLGLTGDLVSIRECLGDRFNYDELMQA